MGKKSRGENQGRNVLGAKGLGGGNGFGVKHPGTNVTGALNCPISTLLP